MSPHFTKPFYRHRPQPDYYADGDIRPDPNVIWQPEVYELASTMAEALGATTLVDVGCGAAPKLLALKDRFQTIGVDYGPNLDTCRQLHPTGIWLDADFESATSLPIDPATLTKSIVICSDVIEHLIDPRPCLALLGSLLKHAPLALLSTPERNLFHGLLHYGPPPNVHHVREWAMAELRAAVGHAGLEIAAAGLTISNNQTWQRSTNLILLRGTPLSQTSFDSELRPQLPSELLNVSDYRYRTWQKTARLLRRKLGL